MLSRSITQKWDKVSYLVFSTNWNKLWFKKIYCKECMFIQLICHKAMVANSWRAQVNSLLNTKCPCCGQCGVGICFFIVIVRSRYLKIKEDVHIA